MPVRFSNSGTRVSTIAFTAPPVGPMRRIVLASWAQAALTPTDAASATPVSRLKADFNASLMVGSSGSLSLSGTRSTLLRQVLTAPPVMPRRRCFWANSVKTRMGVTITLPAAIMIPQAVPMSVTKPETRSGSVGAFLLVRTAANRKSFHARTMLKIADAAIPGLASGSMTIVKVCQRVAPSICAASSSSRGNRRRNCTSSTRRTGC